MYERFYGLKEKPFTLNPDPAFLYFTRQHLMALNLLEYGLAERAAFVLITGEIGSGKTTLIRHLLGRLDPGLSVGLIANTHHAFGDLLQWVMLAFGLDYRAMASAELYQGFTDFLIREFAAGRRVLLVVDEAQNLDARKLEELRVLSNINAGKDQLLQMVLVGQPELRELLRSPALRQLAQRIAVDYHLQALGREEAHAYVRHRLSVAGGDPDLIEGAAIEFAHDRTGGIPRLLNTLCDTALLYGYAEQRGRIDAELMAQVVRDRMAGGILPLVTPAPELSPASQLQ